MGDRRRGAYDGGAILTVLYYRAGQDLVASGFLVLAIGEAIMLSGSAMDFETSIPSFEAGSSLWATGLALVSLPPVFLLPVRTLGLIAAGLFAVTAPQIYAGVRLSPLSSPLPFFVYPFFVATFVGWIWAFLKRNHSRRVSQPQHSACPTHSVDTNRFLASLS